MLAFARARGCSHFIHISTVAAYGLRCAGVDRDESTRLSIGGGWYPLETEYMRSKADAERRVSASGLPHSILRLPVVLGAGSSFSAPAMLPALEAGEAPYFMRNDGKVSVFCVENAGPAVEGFIAAGPQDAAFNVCDHHLPWNELVALYAEASSQPLTWSKRGPLAWVKGMRDGFYGFWIGNGYLGAHYPTERLEALGISLSSDLRAAVRDEVQGGLEGAAF
jgi:nucleoside-diphosphate-sugar epimerase